MQDYTGMFEKIAALPLLYLPGIGVRSTKDIVKQNIKATTKVRKAEDAIISASTDNNRYNWLAKQTPRPSKLNPQERHESAKFLQSLHHKMLLNKRRFVAAHNRLGVDVPTHTRPSKVDPSLRTRKKVNLYDTSALKTQQLKNRAENNLWRQDNKVFGALDKHLRVDGKRLKDFDYYKYTGISEPLI